MPINSGGQCLLFCRRLKLGDILDAAGIYPYPVESVLERL